MPDTTDLVFLGAGVFAADRLGFINIGSGPESEDKAKPKIPEFINIIPGQGGDNAGGVNTAFMATLLSQQQRLSSEIARARERGPGGNQGPPNIINIIPDITPKIPTLPPGPKGPGIPTIPTVPGMPDIPGLPDKPTVQPNRAKDPYYVRPETPDSTPDVRNPLVFGFESARGTGETAERWTGGILGTLTKTGNTLAQSTRALAGKEYNTENTFANGGRPERRRIYEGKLRDVVGGGAGNAWIPGFRPEKGDFIPGSGPVLGGKKKGAKAPKKKAKKKKKGWL